MQVVTSVGQLLKTGTDPRWLLGQFLGFLITVLQKNFKINDPILVYNHGPQII
jgi:hypothetical protein